MVLLVLTLAAFVASVGGGLAMLGHTEHRIASAYVRTTQTTYAAGAGIHLAIDTVAQVPDSTRWPSAGMLPALGSVSRVLAIPAADPVDLDSRTAELNQEAARQWPVGADTPRWRLVGWGRVPQWTPSTLRVAVWLADDVMDADGVPGEDVNGVLMIRAEAFGPRGATHAVLAHVERRPGAVRILSWREE